jgi:hypothetical protein
MRNSPTASTYNEPTVLWRMRRGERLSAHAEIQPTSSGANVLWFVNSRLLGMREFEDWSDAITWSDRIRDQNWTVGWRLTEE